MSILILGSSFLDCGAPFGRSPTYCRQALPRNDLTTIFHDGGDKGRGGQPETILSQSIEIK
jgi:hypothetical protein